MLRGGGPPSVSSLDSVGAIDILIVCTANRCRSAMGEAILRRRLDQRGVPAQVASAGFLEGGAPALVEAVDAMAADGLDLSHHTSRQVTAELVAGADLVVTMTRQHLIELALLDPDHWPRLFQLRDLVRRGEATGPRRGDEPFESWLDRVGADRSRAGLLGVSLADDIADPVGGPPTVFQETRLTLDDLLTRLARVLG